MTFNPVAAAGMTFAEASYRTSRSMARLNAHVRGARRDLIDWRLRLYVAHEMMIWDRDHPKPVSVKR